MQLVSGPETFLKDPFVFCFMGPQQLMFYCILKKEFIRNFGVCVVQWDPIFLEKIYQKFDTLSEFFQKINVLRFKTVSNGKIL